MGAVESLYVRFGGQDLQTRKCLRHARIAQMPPVQRRRSKVGNYNCSVDLQSFARARDEHCKTQQIGGTARGPTRLGLLNPPAHPSVSPSLSYLENPRKERHYFLTPF